MLRRHPINLNKQSQNATVLLIREVLERDIELTEVSIWFRHSFRASVDQPLGLRRRSGSHKTIRTILVVAIPWH